MPLDVSDCLLATGMFCAFICFLFFPLGLGNELGNILGVCSAERRQAYMWSPFLPRPLLLPKIFFSGFPACSPPACLRGQGQGSHRALFTSASTLSTCGVLTVYLSVSPPHSGSLKATALSSLSIHLCVPLVQCFAHGASAQNIYGLGTSSMSTTRSL